MVVRVGPRVCGSADDEAGKIRALHGPNLSPL